MSDDTTTEDSTDTLTLIARGPAVIERERDEGALSVTVTEDVDLEATLDVDPDWIERHGAVRKDTALLLQSDIAELVVDTLSSEDANNPNYRAGNERHSEWTLTLTGRVDDWINVAVRLAQNQISVGPDARIITSACHIIDDLAEFSPDDRPRLAMLDLVEQYDVSDYTRGWLLDELSGDDNRDTGVEEVTADA